MAKKKPNFGKNIQRQSNTLLGIDDSESQKKAEKARFESLNFKVSAEFKAAFKGYCRDNGLKMNFLLEKLFKDYIESQKKED